MAEFERYLQPIEVIHYFCEQIQKQSTHHDLIKQFRPLLVNENSFGAKNQAILKKICNQIVTVKKISGNKFLQLKPYLIESSPHEILEKTDFSECNPLEEEENINENKDVEAPEIDSQSSEARSRAPIYMPSSLEKEEDYFLIPKNEDLVAKG